MKTKVLTSIGCLFLVAGFVRADALLSFDDHDAGDLGPSAGTYTPGSSFTFDITLAVTNSGTDPVPNVTGLSYWFGTSAINNSYFTITNRNLSGSQFSDPQGAPSYPEAIIAGGNNTDLGATLTNVNLPLASDSSYFVASLTIQINPSTPPGTYTIFTTTAATGKRSVAADNVMGTATAHPIPEAIYTITVVPEPATLSLLGLSGIGSWGLTILRRRRGT